SERRNGGGSVLASNGFEPLMDQRQEFGHGFRASAMLGYTQARPSLQSVEAQTAFIAQPALVDVHITAAHSAVDLAFGCCVTGNAAAQRSSGVIDAEVAPGAASAAHRVRSLQEPGAHLESKIGAGQSSDRTDVHDVARIWIVEWPIACN